jgi:hypothetical protein
MKFVIRDDDLNYWSTPEDIKLWYGDIFDKKIPVGFATIPFVTPHSDVYTANAKKEDKEFPISENGELVNYILTNPLIDVLQHGCTHETNDGVFEYAASKGLFEKTKRGHAELEKTFGKKINVFVPPHDWISSHGIESIEAENMDCIVGRSTGIRNFIPRWQYVRNFFRMGLHIFARTKPAFPFVLDFGKHKEMCSYRLEAPDVFAGLLDVHTKDGIFVVVTHIHFYTEEKKARLMELIKKAEEYGAEFVLPSQIFTS